MKKATLADFQLNRQWGVRGYPSVLLRKGQQLHLIARGDADAEFDQLWEAVQMITKN
jgi:putative protein-disulfide isomerase